MAANDKKFAVFILSNGRPDRIVTHRVLRSGGYTGKIYIICDDEDETLPRYKEKYGDEVIVFSKKDYEGKFDLMDNFEGNKVIVYARNACYDIARDLGLDYFFEYEDDYTTIQYRFLDGEFFRGAQVKNLDKALGYMCEALDNTGACTIAFAQGGDFIGGAASLKNSTYKRKAMNSFVFRVNEDPEDDIKFIGRMNDDVNTYLTQGAIGKLFFQITDIAITQRTTQKNSGGNTEAYKESGTYVKSFYSVMAAPSCCRISMLGVTNMRIHHRITWKNAVPKILSEEFKKR